MGRAVVNPVRAMHQHLPSSSHEPARIPGSPGCCLGAQQPLIAPPMDLFQWPRCLWEPWCAQRHKRKMHILLKVIDCFPGLEHQHWCIMKCPSIFFNHWWNKAEGSRNAFPGWAELEAFINNVCMRSWGAGFIWFKLLMAATLLLVFALRWIGFLC